MKPITIVASLIGAGVLWSGCVSESSAATREGTYPLVPLNLARAQQPFVLVLDTVITANGLGSWDREAPWDEYVVTLANHGAEPLTIAAAALTDFAGASYPPGETMKALERLSTALEAKWHDAGLAFSRDAAPAGDATGGVRLIGANGGVTSTEVRMAVATAMIPIPKLYTRRIVSLNQRYYADEFEQRRLVLPLTLAPGAVRVGSLFFPMVPNPCSLSLPWSSGAASGELTLPLGSVHGLHVVAGMSPAAVR